jgi:cation transport ATPase
MYQEQFRLSQLTIRNIKENLFWAFAYNVIGIPVAMGVLHLFVAPAQSYVGRSSHGSQLSVSRLECSAIEKHPN